jgi:hypothetical protein
MKGKVEYKYKWWRNDGETGKTKKVKKRHKEALKECAEERIAEMMGRGFTSGELCLRITDKEEGMEYKGWWRVV